MHQRKSWSIGAFPSCKSSKAALMRTAKRRILNCRQRLIGATVGRFAEQTSKGLMWRDIGLGDWLFDFDQEAEIAKYTPAVLAMAKNPAAAKANLVKARKFVEQRQRETMKVLRKSL